MVRLLFAALVALVLVASPVLAQTPPHSDHYLSYRVEPRQLTTPIEVGDQFIPQLGAVAQVFERLLNPVKQDGVTYVDSTAHLDWWRITPNPAVGRRVAVINKFGHGVWDIDTLEFLLAPSRKNQQGIPPPDNINHFLCYRATGPTPDEEVSLEDQFRHLTVRVGPPRFFCNPCRKRHNQEYPIVDPEVHLAVYEVLPPTFTAQVITLDQFGSFTPLVISAPPEFLFVPSFKDEPVPTEPGTWGRIKSTYSGEGATQQ